MKKIKEIFDSSTTWFVLMVICISSSMAADTPKVERLFTFWALVSLCVWYCKANKD